MMGLKITSISVIVILLVTGCYYDTEEEIYPSIECLTLEMSYTNDILPIIEMDCYVCHSAAANFGNVILEGYGGISNYVADGTLLGVIKHEPGFSPMPKNQAQILQCEIEKIEAWITQGALNN
ncbi:MAG: hypothetical protein ACJA1A_003567 [Saprospiraceae bacterium]|jgi:hypothetical protein